MSSFRRTAAVWVLRQAARRVAQETARRRQSGAGAGSAYRPADADTGATYRPSGERPAWARGAGPRSGAVPQRVEDLVRRAWPLVDTPANRDRAARFVERMRSTADSRR